jgi:hypothetical protein
MHSLVLDKMLAAIWYAAFLLDFTAVNIALFFCSGGSGERESGVANL